MSHDSKLFESLMALPTGTRVVVRSKKDWRFGAIAKRSADRITLTVASPKGRNYRVLVTTSTPISAKLRLPAMDGGTANDWRSDLAIYDRRW